MYIITKKKDYYDGVVGSMGIDKSIVYNRESVINEDSSTFPDPFRRINRWERRGENPFRNLAYHSTTKKSIYQAEAPFIVGFCGKLYLGWKFYKEESKTQYSYPELITFITYDLEFIKENIESSSWWGKLIDDINYISNYNSLDLFRNLNAPIFIYDNDYERTHLGTYTRKSKEVFITNPTLNDYEFYRVMDSFTAFQEIQMFLGGVLGTGEKDIVEVEDKYKISQHGFDKFSFRRSKANGKKRPQSSR